MKELNINKGCSRKVISIEMKEKKDIKAEKATLELAIIKKKADLLDKINQAVDQIIADDLSTNQLLEPAMAYSTKEQTNSIYFSQTAYLYGTVVLLGGRTTAFLCLDTVEHGTVKVFLPKEVLVNNSENLLYKEMGISVRANRSREDGHIENGEAELVAFLDASNRGFSDERLHAFIESASQEAEENNVSDNWLEELRGPFEE